MSLILTASITQPTFLRGEGVYLTVELYNPGERVDLRGDSGRCRFKLTPPGSTSPLWESCSAPLGDPEGKRLFLGPREQWTGLIPLDRLFDLEGDGRYQVSVDLQWGDLNLEAPPLEFSIEDLRVDRLTVGHRGSPEHGKSFLLFLRKKEAGKSLMTCTAELDKERCGEGAEDRRELGDPFEHRTLPAEATDPVITSTRRAADLWYTFWREGNTLFSFRSASSTNRPIQLPGTVHRLIEPALLDPGSLTHLYALSSKDGAPTLLVVRVMDYLKDPKTPERLLAERVLEAVPDAAVAMIDEVRGKPRRALALVRMDGNTPKVEWMSYSGDAVPDSLHAHAWSSSIAAARIADSRPAVLGIPEGGVNISWIVRQEGNPTAAILCEATFDESGALKGESTTPLTAGSPIKAARIAYLEGVPIAALWTEDGKVLAGNATDLRVMVEKSLDRVPPTFFVLRETPVILEFDPIEGMTLVRVNQRVG